MEPTFTVSGRSSKAIHEVYEAVADPAVLSRYFTTGGAQGRIRNYSDFPFTSPEDGRTLVEILESGFNNSEAGWQAALGQCGVWPEHGINPREGFYV